MIQKKTSLLLGMFCLTLLWTINALKKISLFCKCSLVSRACDASYRGNTSHHTHIHFLSTCDMNSSSQNFTSCHTNTRCWKPQDLLNFTPVTSGRRVHPPHHRCLSQHVRSLYQTGTLYRAHGWWSACHLSPLSPLSICNLEGRNMLQYTWCFPVSMPKKGEIINQGLPLNLSFTEGYDVTVLPTPMPWATSAVGPRTTQCGFQDDTKSFPFIGVPELYFQISFVPCSINSKVNYLEQFKNPQTSIGKIVRGVKHPQLGMPIVFKDLVLHSAIAEANVKAYS